MKTARDLTPVPAATLEPAPRPVSRSVRLRRLGVAIFLFVAVVAVFVLLSGGAK